MLKKEAVDAKEAFQRAQQDAARQAEEKAKALQEKEEQVSSLRGQLKGLKEDLKAAQSLAEWESKGKEGALLQKKKLQAGLPIIGAKMLQCPGSQSLSGITL